METRLTGVGFQGGLSISDILQSQDDPVHPVCRPNQAGNGGFTFASTIMTLGDRPFLQLTVGPPNESSYRTFHFKSALD